MTPCTNTVRTARPVRGGKNFEARYQAELTAQAAHSALYCGAVSKTLAWGAAGHVSSVTASPEAELFAARCTMPEAMGAPQRFVATDIAAAAVNPCI